ncbi:MAG: hypothetical protein Q7J16_13025 [Candidatus Cloacimonadales bacterium]|nr:hypothetical protein [Candidatus Cloacimonadales bacterium]
MAKLKAEVMGDSFHNPQERGIDVPTPEHWNEIYIPLSRGNEGVETDNQLLSEASYRENHPAEIRKENLYQSFRICFKKKASR